MIFAASIYGKSLHIVRDQYVQKSDMRLWRPLPPPSNTTLILRNVSSIPCGSLPLVRSDLLILAFGMNETP